MPNSSTQISAESEPQFIDSALKLFTVVRYLVSAVEPTRFDKQEASTSRSRYVFETELLGQKTRDTYFFRVRKSSRK